MNVNLIQNPKIVTSCLIFHGQQHKYFSVEVDLVQGKGSGNGNLQCSHAVIEDGTGWRPSELTPCCGHQHLSRTQPDTTSAKGQGEQARAGKHPTGQGQITKTREGTKSGRSRLRLPPSKLIPRLTEMLHGVIHSKITDSYAAGITTVNMRFIINIFKSMNNGLFVHLSLRPCVTCLPPLVLHYLIATVLREQY